MCEQQNICQNLCALTAGGEVGNNTSFVLQESHSSGRDQYTVFVHVFQTLMVNIDAIQSCETHVCSENARSGIPTLSAAPTTRFVRSVFQSSYHWFLEHRQCTQFNSLSKEESLQLMELRMLVQLHSLQKKLFLSS